MNIPKSRIIASRVLLEYARELLNEDCEVHERLRHVLDLSIEAFEQAQLIEESNQRAEIIPLFTALNRES